jgi:hypothetical protein
MSVRLALVLGLVSFTGCAAMMASMTPKPRTADNPLVSGQPLEATKKGSSVAGLSEQDCDRWPFEDSVSVRVTEQQICISAVKHKDASATWVGEPTANSSEGFQVANDAGEGGYINANKKRSSKIAKCFSRGYNANVSIWAFEYEGCAPNNGTVTAATKSLRVGDESWDFPGATAAASAGSAAPSGT